MFDHASAFRPTRLPWHNQKLFDPETTTPAPVPPPTPPNPPPFPCSPQPATVYLMCIPFEIFTGNPSILLPTDPELLRLPTYVRYHFFCDGRAVLPHSSKTLGKLFFIKRCLVTLQHMHYSLPKMLWITQNTVCQVQLQPSGEPLICASSASCFQSHTDTACEWY